MPVERIPVSRGTQQVGQRSDRERIDDDRKLDHILWREKDPARCSRKDTRDPPIYSIWRTRWHTRNWITWPIRRQTKFTMNCLQFLSACCDACASLRDENALSRSRVLIARVFALCGDRSSRRPIYIYTGLVLGFCSQISGFSLLSYPYVSINTLACQRFVNL